MRCFIAIFFLIAPLHKGHYTWRISRTSADSEDVNTASQGDKGALRRDVTPRVYVHAHAQPENECTPPAHDRWGFPAFVSSQLQLKIKTKELGIEGKKEPVNRKERRSRRPASERRGDIDQASRTNSNEGGTVIEDFLYFYVFK